MIRFLALLLMTGTAQAGPWEVFVARCLEPMENFATPDVGGLIAEAPRHGYRVWSTREGWALWQQDARDAAPVCILSGFDWDESVQGAVLGWAEASMGAERYEAQPKLNLQAPTVFLSTTWREPVAEVSFQRFHPEWGPYLMVRETDLES